jgi:hypothetical protein
MSERAKYSPRFVGSLLSAVSERKESGRMLKPNGKQKEPHVICELKLTQEEALSRHVTKENDAYRQTLLQPEKEKAIRRQSDRQAEKDEGQ